MDKYICLDIGGTAIKYGLADSRGRLFNKDSIPNCIARDGVDAFLEQVLGLIGPYQKYFKIQGAAVSMAGMVNPLTGEMMHAAPHFPGLTGINLMQLVTNRLHLPCWVENDVNCAALGEYWLGNGKGPKACSALRWGPVSAAPLYWTGNCGPAAASPLVKWDRPNWAAGSTGKKRLR